MLTKKLSEIETLCLKLTLTGIDQFYEMSVYLCSQKDDQYGIFKQYIYLFMLLKKSERKKLSNFRIESHENRSMIPELKFASF